MAGVAAEEVQQCLVRHDADAPAAEFATQAEAVEEPPAHTRAPACARRVALAGLACGLAAAAVLILAGGARRLGLARGAASASRVAQPQRLFATAGPTLFCWSVMRVEGYERDILELQLQNRAGIFECDGQTVFSEDPVRLGGGDFETVPIGHVSDQVRGQGPLATSSWVNTETFFRAWDELRRSGRFSEFDWVIKTDPDTVILPGVLRQHLLQRGLAGEVYTYLVNCPQVDNGFYGSVEATSRAAFATLMDNLDVCRQTLPYTGWGEDLFAQKCMDSAGVGRAGDFDLVLDGNCHGHGAAPGCAPGRPAYHPLKSPGAWMQCWEQAQQGGGGDGFMAPRGRHRFPVEAVRAEWSGNEPPEGLGFLGDLHLPSLPTGDLHLPSLPAGDPQLPSLPAYHR